MGLAPPTETLEAFILPVWDIPPGWRLGDLVNRYWLTSIDPAIQWSVTLISDGDHEPVKAFGETPQQAVRSAIELAAKK